MERFKSLHYWRNIAFAVGVALLLGLIAGAVYIFIFTTRAAENALAPPQIPLSQTPESVGITEYENITLTTSDAIRLSGWYIHPEPDNSIVIILAHGYAQNRLQLLPEAKLLIELGYGIFLFDFRGHGESEPAMVTLGDHERRDLEAAIDFVSTQPHVSRIGALGFSMGAAVLAQVAAQDERLSAVVIEAAFPTLVEEIRYRSRIFGPLSQIPSLRVMRKAGVDVDDVRPIDDLCAISPRSLLLIYGDLDVDVPPGTARAMFEAVCGSANLWIVPGAGHQNFTDVALEEYTERLLSFFD
jgi:dipeptidyl aminopeptidase/acylaminoacyl peptidase